MAHLLRVGDYVNVSPSATSSGGTGWVKNVDENTGNAMVEYVVQKKVSKEVNPNRIVCATLDNVSRSRSPDDGNDDRPTLRGITRM